MRGRGGGLAHVHEAGAGGGDHDGDTPRLGKWQRRRALDGVGFFIRDPGLHLDRRLLAGPGPGIGIGGRRRRRSDLRFLGGHDEF